MSKEYGKVFKGKLVRLYNEDEFNLEMSYLHLNFEGGPNNKSFIDNLIATYNHEYVDEFIKWYTERYHVSGKQYVTGFTGFQHQNKDGDWVDTLGEIPKRQSSEYVKLLKRDKDNNAYFVSYINPETIYFNYNSLRAEIEEANKKRRFKNVHTSGPIPQYTDYRQGQHSHTWSGYRSSNHFERWYAQQADTRYYELLGEPIPRLHAKGRTANKWDDWELEPRSGGTGWKEQTKDRHQWEHNLRNKQEGYVDVGKGNPLEYDAVQSYWYDYEYYGQDRPYYHPEDVWMDEQDEKWLNFYLEEGKKH